MNCHVLKHTDLSIKKHFEYSYEFPPNVCHCQFKDIVCHTEGRNNIIKVKILYIRWNRWEELNEKPCVDMNVLYGMLEFVP